MNRYLRAGAALLCLSLVGCRGAELRLYIEQSTREYRAPSVTASPATGATILHDDHIVLTFGAAMNPASLVLGGDLAAESDGGTWSTVTVADDKLAVAPATRWTSGSARRLTVDCSDTEGNPAATTTLTYLVLDGVYYVHGETGNDTNPGTRDKPKATIQAAITAAKAALAAVLFEETEVHVAKGTYHSSSGDGTCITMEDGVSLLGGYAPDFGSRDFQTYETTILDPSTTGGGDWASMNIALDGGTAVRAATVIEGFTVQGGGGGNSTAIACIGSSPTIRGNRIVAGTATDLAYTIGVSDAASPSIIDNTIEGTLAVSVGGVASIRQNAIYGGGWNPTTHYGSAVMIWQSSGFIEDNTIYASGDGEGAAVYCGSTSGPLKISGNVIYGGSCPGERTAGIAVDSGNPEIFGNVICGGTGSEAIAMRCAGDSDASVYNNLILAGTPAIPGTDQGKGVELKGGKVRNNTIVVPSVSGSSGIVFRDDVNPQVHNNIIVMAGSGGEACIDASGGGTSGNVSNNLLWRPGGGVLYIAPGPVSYSAIGEVNALSSASDNVSADPALVDPDGPDNDLFTIEDNDWHLTASSPLEVRTGGLVGSGWGFTADMDGVIRTGDGSTGWSMGAYELD